MVGEQPTDDLSEHTLHCPGCGHDGVFDGQGRETRTFARIDKDGRKRIKETRYRSRCPQCTLEFLTVEDSEVIARE